MVKDQSSSAAVQWWSDIQAIIERWWDTQRLKVTKSKTKLKVVVPRHLSDRPMHIEVQGTPKKIRVRVDDIEKVFGSSDSLWKMMNWIDGVRRNKVLAGERHE